jgi:putative phage-type endonuclease
MSSALLINDRAAWLERRRRVISATDIAAIAGVHPYSTPRKVYLDKLGLEPELEENDAMRFGNYMEPIIAAEFIRTNPGVGEVVKADFVTHPECEFFGCTPDFYVGDDAVLECKYAGQNTAKAFGVEGTDYVPDHYHIQVQWQLFCTGRKVGYLMVCTPPSFRLYTIPADHDLHLQLAFHARKFWHEYVKREVAPPVTGHKPDTDALNDAHPMDNGQLVVAPFAVDEAAAKLREVTAHLGAIEEEQARLQNILKECLGDGQILETTEGRFTWKTQERAVTDWKGLAKAHNLPAEWLQAFTKTQTTRVFRTPFGGKA